MKISLKTLKEGKSQKKDYKFLTSVEELITKEYKEILPEFTKENYNEALIDLEKNNIGFAVYISPTVLKFSNKISNASLDSKKEKLSFENLKISLLTAVTTPKSILTKEGFGWRSSYTAKLSELFVITDLDEFESFAKTFEAEAVEKTITSLKESLVEDDKDTVKEVTRIKKYGKDYKDNRYSSIAVALLESLEETDNKDKFKKVADAISKIIYKSESCNDW